MPFADPAKGIEAILDEGFKNLYPTGNAAQWCSQYHMLASELSSSAGTVVFDEYQKALLSVIGDQSTPERISILKSSRVGMTTLCNAMACFGVAHNRNVLIYQATGEDARLYSKESIESSLRENSVTREYLKDIEKSAWVVGNYICNGSIIRCRGANSPSSYRRVDSSFVWMDEISSYTRQNVGATKGRQGEGDIAELAFRAAKTDASPKLILMSSPVAQEECSIFRHFMHSGMRFAFNVICPNHSCGAPIPLRWSNFDFKNNSYSKNERAASVQYRCPVCSKKFPQTKLDAAMRDGFFVVEKYPLWYENDNEDECEPDIETKPYWGYSIMVPDEDPPYLLDGNGKRTDWPENKIGFFVNSFLNKRIRWSSLVREFLDAKEDELLLRAFSQQTRGVPFVSRKGRVSEHVLDKCRIPVDPEQLDNNYKFVVAGADIGRNYISVSVYAWTRNYDILVLDCIEFQGETDRPGAQAWNGLIDWLHSKPKWKRQDGTILPLDCFAIDCKWLTNVVYQMVQFFDVPARFLVRGIATTNRTPLVSRGAREAKYKGLPIINVSDTETKDLISDYFGRDKVKINSKIEPRDYLQYGSEKRTRVKNKFGAMESKWVKTSTVTRNERFDEIRYALGAIIALNIGWDSIRLTPDEKRGLKSKEIVDTAHLAAKEFKTANENQEPRASLFD